MIWPSRLLKQKSFLEIVKLSSRNGVSPSRVRVVDPCLLKFYNMEWSFVHKTWEKWASVSVGAGSSLKAALLLNYDPSGPSRLLSTIAEQEGIKVNPVELAQFMDLIKHDALQTDSFSFIIGPNQYVVTSIHENWLCARCMNTSKPAGEGAIIMQTAAFILVALYDGSIGSASRAMAAVDQFAGQLGRRNL